MQDVQYRYGSLIAGSWLECGSGGQEMVTFNPARPAEVVGRYRPATPADIDRVVAAAQRAQVQWAQLPLAERQRAYGKFIDALEANVEPLARAITLEMGKVLKEARNEILKSCAEARFMLAHALEAAGGQILPALRPGMHNQIRRRPRGVIAAVAAWNFPVMTPMRKIAPALAFGNAVIVKPSEFTPAACCLLAELAQGILPDGLLQIVLGGPQLADHLVRHRGIQGVSFTGSVVTGRKIRAATADNLAEAALEMGGKNAAVVNDVDDLGACLDQITEAAFMSSGQRCTAISRVLVRRELHQHTVQGLGQRAGALAVGDGFAPTSQIGPITHAGQLARIDGMVRHAAAAGAHIVTGGMKAKVPGCPGGLFFAPTVIDGVRPDMEIAVEEVFGPVICVLPYDTLDEAFEILNRTDYGLTASLFSHDTRLVARFIDECQTGMMHINHGTIPDSHMPFGGIKASGVGAYSLGASAAAFFTTEHAIYVGP